MPKINRRKNWKIVYKKITIKDQNKKEHVVCFCPRCAHKWTIFNPWFSGCQQREYQLEGWSMKIIGLWPDFDWDVYPHKATCCKCQGISA